MLKVAVDATPLLGQPTGVGTFVDGALRALVRHDDLALSAYALSLRGRTDLPARLPRGVRAHTRRMPANVLLRAWDKADVPPASWFLGDVDVVHGTNFAVPPAPHAVVTVHDLTPLRFPELANPRTAGFPALVRRAVERGAWVHTPSRFVAAEVVDAFGADPERVVAVHHGLPPVEEGGPPVVDGPYVLALGTVEPRKDLPSLVRAFSALAELHPGLQLVVAGPDGWGADPLPPSDRIHRIGWVDTAAKSSLLRHAAVYAYPSRYEGFGFPPLEAMAVGVPVVATTAGALPEVLGDGALLVEPGDSDALAEAIERAVTDEVVRSGLIERGRRQAATFDWADCAAGLASLYRRAAG
ncbi:MAG TPA: glycosyltransferase family 1 protein [Acidimicrobiales bacterium]|nr:glycosyltransferase family 1 protein [Acidimicrobiales bacterium]